MSRALFVVVEGGHLHRNPSFEDCNVDDATVTNRYKTLADVPSKALKLPCEKCRPLEELALPPELPGDGSETVAEGAEAGPDDVELSDPADG